MRPNGLSQLRRAVLKLNRPTTSTANLLGLMSLGRRGEQVVLESETHMVWVEGWNLAYICGLVPRLIRGDRGRMPLGEVEQVISDWRAFSPTASWTMRPWRRR
jgi:threonine aldolase